MTEFGVLHRKWLKDDPAHAAGYAALTLELKRARELVRAAKAADSPAAIGEKPC